MRRAYAIALLAWHFWKHILLKVTFLYRRGGQNRFVENYREDRVFPVPASVRDRLPEWQACTGCGLCDAYAPHGEVSLMTLVGEEDLVARIGGDEFALLVEFTDVDSFQGLLNSLDELNDHPIDMSDGLQLFSSWSFGATRRLGGETMANWLSRSDRAMYVQKSQGRETPLAA